MANPWEKYQQPTTPTAPSNPWEKYGGEMQEPQAQVPVQQIEEPSMAGKALDYGLRALDYGGGLVRTGLAEVGDVFRPGDRVTSEDWKKAISGKAPGTAQYLERLDVPEGPSVDLPLIGKTTTRGAAGLIGDIATDPLTYVSGGTSALSKAAQARNLPRVAGAVEKVGSGIQKGLTAPSRAVEKLGEKVFKSGLKNVDKDLAAKGIMPISDLLKKEGASGSMKSLEKASEKLGNKLSKERASLYKKVMDSGAKVDMTEATQSAQEYIAKLRENPLKRDLAETLQNKLDLVKAEGFTDIQKASDWKSSIYDALPQNAYGPNGKVLGEAKEFSKKLASDFRKAISNTAESVEKGLGKKVDDVNEKWSSVLTARKPFEREVKKAVTPNKLTTVDAMYGGLGALGGYGAALDPFGVGGGLLALKKAADISKTTGARTRVGQGLIKAGESGILDQPVRRGLIGINQDE